MNMVNYTPSHHTHFMTFGGEARSGKGTSVTALQNHLESHGSKVCSIDQGIKFRVFGELALGTHQPMEDPVALTDFMKSPSTQRDMLGMLKEVATMGTDDKNDLLYNPRVAAASAQIGAVPVAHEIVVGLLKKEVEQAVDEKHNVVIIDGRAMEKYGQQFEKDNLGYFSCGWYFKCDSSVAATRSLGWAGKQNFTTDEIVRLHEETLEIRNRNRRDKLRSTDPMCEPTTTYHLDLDRYRSLESDVPYKQGHLAIRKKMVTVDTTYTTSVEQMLTPVVEIASLALLHRGAVSHAAAGIEVAPYPIPESVWFTSHNG